MHTTMEALFDELVGEMCELRELASREVGYEVPLEEAADRRKADTNAVWSAISNDAYWPWTLRTAEIKAAVMRELRSDTLRLLSAHRKVASNTLEADANMDVSAILRQLYKHKAEAQRRQQQASAQASAQALANQMTLSGSPDGKFFGGPPQRAGRQGASQSAKGKGPAATQPGGRRQQPSPQRAVPPPPQYEYAPPSDGEDDGGYEDFDEAAAMEEGGAVPGPAYTPRQQQQQHGAGVARAAMQTSTSRGTASSSGHVTPKGRAANALFNKLTAAPAGAEPPSHPNDLL